MPTKEILQKYASLVVNQGACVQKGQPLYLNSSVANAEFTKMVVEEAYKAGAKKVTVNWSFDDIERLNYTYQDTETLSEVPSWAIDKYKTEVIDANACLINIASKKPGIFKDIDGEKLQKVNMALSKAMKPYRYYSMNSVGQWSIIAYPNVEWAKKVFPDESDEVAVEKLWDAILKACYIDENSDPIKNWEKHDQELMNHCKLLNEYNFKALHFKNGLGTDLVVNLAKDHIWAGGMEPNKDGVYFNPNIPTEEVFTMPDRDNVNGTVVATKPLDYQGKLIEGFSFTFKDGKVIDYKADKNKDALDNLLNLDEGSKHLGEVALISNDSPISNLGILFYNTLFDENASCHLALGACYPTTTVGGDKMSEEELLKHGGNISMNHCDFMFGSSDMEVTGITFDGSEVQIFTKGNFAI